MDEEFELVTKMSLTLRLYVEGVLRDEETILKGDPDGPWKVKRARDRHFEMSRGKLHIIEFEWLDEPKERRFWRIGTDPRGMVQPLLVQGTIEQAFAELIKTGKLQ